MDKKNVAIFLWPGMTMLDSLGPHQVLGYMPELNVYTFARTTEPFKADTGMTLTADYGLTDLPSPDILIVGGGANPLPEMADPDVVAAIRKAGEHAQYVTSVCTGALILAEAGLLEGHRATTHWAYREILASYPGVTLADGRIVRDGNRITAGGVTAGIDFALTLIGEVIGEAAGQTAELIFEYAPDVPYGTGTPATAPAAVTEYATGLCRQLSPGLAEFAARAR